MKMLLLFLVLLPCLGFGGELEESWKYRFTVGGQNFYVADDGEGVMKLSVYTGGDEDGGEGEMPEVFFTATFVDKAGAGAVPVAKVCHAVGVGAKDGELRWGSEVWSVTGEKGAWVVKVGKRVYREMKVAWKVHRDVLEGVYRGNATDVTPYAEVIVTGYDRVDSKGKKVRCYQVVRIVYPDNAVSHEVKVEASYEKIGERAAEKYGAKIEVSEEGVLMFGGDKGDVFRRGF